MIVALTGGTGFLGGHVIDRLLGGGHAVRALTRSTQASRSGVVWIPGSLSHGESLRAVCEGADAVVHVAGVVNAPDRAGFDAGNARGVEAVVDAAVASQVARFVHVSSLAAREPGLSMYGASKRAGEDAVTASPLDWQIVRPPAIYGPGDMEMLDLFRMAKRGVIALPPGGRLSIIHAEDLARLIVALAEGDAARALYEPDDGVPGGWSHAALGHAIAAAVGTRAMTLAMPRAVMRLGAALDSIVRGARAKLTADRVAYMCHPDWTVDRAHGVPDALWRPAIATPDGLAATARWYRAKGLL